MNLDSSKGTLWIFGDSNSATVSPTGESGFYNYVQEYENFTNSNLINYSVHLAKSLNLNLANHALHGNSNYAILESFSRNYDKINQATDKVVINISEPTRFRVAIGKGPRLFSVSVGSIVPIEAQLSQQAIEEILINRMSEGFVEETAHLFNLVNFSLPNCHPILWSPFESVKKHMGVLNIDRLGKIYAKQCKSFMSSITLETQGKIKDNHMGNIGNKTLAKLLYFFMNETDNNKLQYVLNITDKYSQVE